MGAQTLNEALNELLTLELLTQDELDQLMRVPEIDKVLAGMTPAEILAWKAVNHKTEDRDLYDLWDMYPENLTEEQEKTREETIDQAMEKLVEIEHQLNMQHLAVLRDELILSSAQVDRVKELIEGEELATTPADALVMLITNGYLAHDEWQAILAEMEKDRSFASAHKRVALLTEVKQKLETHRIEEKEEASRKFWNSFIPGPGAVMIIFFGALIVGVIYTLYKPIPVPLCDAPTIVKTVDGMLFSSKFNQQIGSTGDLYSKPQGLPRLIESQQAGYLPDEKIRGCVGIVEWGTRKIRFGYTVRPAPDERGRHVVAGADAEIIEARYGSIDEQGRRTKLARPIGLEAMQVIIRSAVEKLPPNEILIRRMEQMAMLLGPKRKKDSGQPVRESEIVEVEPLGNCQPVSQSKNYNCEVFLVIRDLMLEAFGRTRILKINHTFTFAPDEATGGWKISEAFSQEYAQALLKGREITLKAEMEARKQIHE